MPRSGNLCRQNINQRKSKDDKIQRSQRVGKEDCLGVIQSEIGFPRSRDQDKDIWQVVSCEEKGIGKKGVHKGVNKVIYQASYCCGQLKLHPAGGLQKTTPSMHLRVIPLNRQGNWDIYTLTHQFLVEDFSQGSLFSWNFWSALRGRWCGPLRNWRISQAKRFRFRQWEARVIHTK